MLSSVFVHEVNEKSNEKSIVFASHSASHFSSNPTSHQWPASLASPSPRQPCSKNHSVRDVNSRKYPKVSSESGALTALELKLASFEGECCEYFAWKKRNCHLALSAHNFWDHVSVLLHRHPNWPIPEHQIILEHWPSIQRGKELYAMRCIGHLELSFWSTFTLANWPKKGDHSP